MLLGWSDWLSAQPVYESVGSIYCTPCGPHAADVIHLGPQILTQLLVFRSDNLAKITHHAFFGFGAPPNDDVKR